MLAKVTVTKLPGGTTSVMLPEGSTIEEMLEEMDMDGIMPSSVKLNDRTVERYEFDTTVLNSGDKVSISAKTDKG